MYRGYRLRWRRPSGRPLRRRLRGCDGPLSFLLLFTYLSKHCVLFFIALREAQVHLLDGPFEGSLGHGHGWCLRGAVPPQPRIPLGCGMPAARRAAQDHPADGESFSEQAGSFAAARLGTA